MKLITKGVLKKFIDAFGEDFQSDMAIEEMAELIKELLKFKRYGNNRDEIVEEIVDVQMTLDELKMVFKATDKEMKKIADYKIRRTESKIK